MNELTQERSRIHASIVINALAYHHIASDMSELTQERSRIHASIVINALANYEIASNMNELTQERSMIQAGTNTFRMLSAFNLRDTIRSHLQLTVANSLVCCCLR